MIPNRGSPVIGDYIGGGQVLLPLRGLGPSIAREHVGQLQAAVYRDVLGRAPLVVASEDTHLQKSAAAMFIGCAGPGRIDAQNLRRIPGDRTPFIAMRGE